MRVGSPIEVFQDGCREHTLLYQRCAHCAHVQSYPRTACTACHRDDLEWHVSALRGRIASFTRVERAANPRFHERVPYLLALVDVDEGFRLMMNLDIGRTVRIGDAVEIGFVTDADGRSILHGQTRG